VSIQIYKNAKIATMAEDTDTSYGLIDQGALVAENGTIKWVGPEQDLPEQYANLAADDLQGRVITPGLVDCHTHLVFGGNRAREFEMRLEGASYEEIAKAGGGIVSTVTQTRALSEGELVADALPRLDALIKEGVTTIEIKSGYGLTVPDELKMLRAARQLEKHRNVRIKTTFLGAHALPNEYADRSDAYIDEICIPALKQAAAEGLADAVDAFCEGIGFSPEQVTRVFECAKKLNIPIKIHSEQLSNLNGTALAASYGAISADHLEYLDEAGVHALKESGTVAVILPGAFFYLRETQMPPLETLRQVGVPMALATDCNPGSSPLASLLLTLNMACTLFRFTPEEALSGITRNGAKALGLAAEIGTLEIGKRADLAIWNIEHPAELSYRIGFNPLYKCIYGEHV
jgi:imidazolonepropionase